MLSNQLVSLLFITLLIFTGLGLSNGDDMDSSDDDDDDDDNTGLMRLRRQLKKFAYADPCEVGCVTNKLHKKVPIKVLAKKCKDECKDKINFKPAIYYK